MFGTAPSAIAGDFQLFVTLKPIVMGIAQLLPANGNRFSFWFSMPGNVLTISPDLATVGQQGWILNQTLNNKVFTFTEMGPFVLQPWYYSAGMIGNIIIFETIYAPSGKRGAPSVAKMLKSAGELEAMKSLSRLALGLRN